MDPHQMGEKRVANVNTNVLTEKRLERLDGWTM